MSSPNISLRNMVCFFFFSVEHEITGSIFWSINAAFTICTNIS